MSRALLRSFAVLSHSDVLLPKAASPRSLFSTSSFRRHEPISISPSRFSSSASQGPMEASDLAAKNCVPCNSKDIRPMSEESANELLAQVQGWGLLTESGIMKLHRSWKVKNFIHGLEFFQLIADVAEAQGHHPDLHLVGWNNVKVELWTHSVGGLTENDFILAAKINSLNVEHLLRRKAAI
ncbi:putative pterin-4-alpha-carbinolamine dehydratase [Ananas comosus]|uniref:4a-hydroxytetrahydrobiopterin dehydratase n=1 Tax=Ananas comosus TaxID=4615 RepID=A0A199UXS6_ANACO|nr:putative pterin-4-alpha-carbinolamine dehydratase [Ananas comosus]